MQMKDEINTIWIGCPTTENAWMPGHAEAGPISVATALSDEERRTVQFWCLEEYADAFQSIFANYVRIRVCPIQPFLKAIQDGSIPFEKILHYDDEKIKKNAEDILYYIKVLLAPERVSTRYKVVIKDLLSFFVLEIQGGYYLDTNVEAMPNRTLTLPTFNCAVMHYSKLLLANSRAFEGRSDSIYLKNMTNENAVCGLYRENDNIIYIDKKEGCFGIHIDSSELLEILKNVHKTRRATIEESQKVYAAIKEAGSSQRRLDIGVMYVHFNYRARASLGLLRALTCLKSISFDHDSNSTANYSAYCFEKTSGYVADMLRGLAFNLIDTLGSIWSWVSDDGSVASIPSLGLVKYYYGTHRPILSLAQNSVYQLLFFVRNRSHVQLERFLKGGIDPNQFNDNIPIIWSAILMQNKEACRLLLQYGAKIKDIQITQETTSDHSKIRKLMLEDLIKEKCEIDDELKQIVDPYL